MQRDSVRFKRTIRDIGGTIYIAIPKEILAYIELNKDQDVEMIAQEGKHGKFVAFWKKESDQQDSE